ncbi:MarR family winged helix-turn-helix transcriptional regulator [Vibrio panuliri]|uniref:MarR family transcriptional regulator n=1 Tax=Vibrio panuliri TaxID=1381081 RepID=A0A1Q9HQL5_9VIBR|nr:MarR family transcriptional regulator [Vibrio panuliri]KAB1458005.1 MarR family transcriptional regulator [Vibrio panuliri]OLQ89634.1 MarR family transcriptional regulator [Vibrio panuliri]OLQ93126.1 MarR family transcriptional regulator [Vibrio panuliri]
MSDTKSLDTLFQLVHSVKRNLHEQIEQLELDIAPMHVRVLKIVTHQPNCSAVDISGFLSRDKAQVTRLLNALIEKGLIAKLPNPQDKRSQCLKVTEKGQEIVSKITSIDAKLHDKMTKDLSSEQLAQFEQVVGKMVANLNA